MFECTFVIIITVCYVDFKLFSSTYAVYGHGTSFAEIKLDGKMLRKMLLFSIKCKSISKLVLILKFAHVSGMYLCE